MSRSGTGHRLLTRYRGFHWLADPTFSPDGSTIAVGDDNRNPSGGWRIRALTPDGEFRYSLEPNISDSFYYAGIGWGRGPLPAVDGR